MLKIHYFSLFFKSFYKPSLNFYAFGRKTQIVWKFWEHFEIFWWKLYRKIEFFIFYFDFFMFFENLLLKIEPSEITPFFYNIFSVSWGVSPLSPRLHPWSYPPHVIPNSFMIHFGHEKRQRIAFFRNFHNTIYFKIFNFFEFWNCILNISVCRKYSSAFTRKP